MFGSTNSFGQTSSSPFGTQSVLGQTGNPFAHESFGSASPFGSQTGGSIFGSTSIGVFGATQSSSPLSSTPAFGASSTPAFGSSMPAFGASSTPAFGSASSSFGGSSIFGQKPAFGGFGSASTQTSPFGSSFQQTQPAFGSGLFGSTTAFGSTSTPAFGATSTPAFSFTSTPAFGSTSTPAFGSTSTPAFGSTSTPAFGATSTPAFGATSTPAFGTASTPAFGSTTMPTFGGTAFGVSSTSAFGSTGTPAFGASSTPIFGSSSIPALGIPSTPTFGSSTGAFGASSTPSFSFGSAPAFGQSSSAFGSTTFGTISSPFGVQSSPFGAQARTPAFGSSGFGQSGFLGQHGGSRVAPYTPTADVDAGSATQPTGKLESVSAMPVYKDKSHEELRWEDYQRGDKGGPNPIGHPVGGIFTTPSQPNPFASTGTFGQTTANLFSAVASSNPFGPKTPTFGSSGFGSSSASAFGSPFGTASSSLFGGTTSAAAPSLFGLASAPSFGASSSLSLFGSSSMPSFGSSSSIFGSASAPGTGSAFGSSFNTQSSGLFQSSTPSLVPTTPAFGQTPSFVQATPAFGQTSLFGTPSTGFGGNLFSSSSSLPFLGTSNPVGFGQTTPSFSTGFQPGAPAQTSGASSFGNVGQTPAASSGFGGVSNVFGQSPFGQSATSQSNVVMQPVPVTNPFGMLPAMPQMPIGRAGSATSIQHKISSMPVADKPSAVRISSLFTPKHLSRRRIRLPARKYNPKSDFFKVPFFNDDEETPSTLKADAFFIPRENPKSLFIRPMDQWPSRSSAEKQSPSKDASTLDHQDGKISEEASIHTLDDSTPQNHCKGPSENGPNEHQNSSSAKSTQKPHGTHEDHAHKGDSYITVSGHRAGEAAIVYEHDADIEALMPKLRHADYYTVPRTQELAAKERAEPSYCCHVKDFVVGRHGYGSIKFIGETDVRQLDLETLVQFNNREVIVYMDENKKPPIGQGLNKPAEVTLLNIKCINKKTGEQYTEGPKVDKYKEMLMKKTQDQGAEFVSFDPSKGEWKFKVNHFSRYELDDEEDFCACCLSDCSLCLCRFSDFHKK